MEREVIIHMVAEPSQLPPGQNPTFYSYMCDAHTHGLKDCVGHELQIVLLLDPQKIQRILTLVGEQVLDGLTLHDGDLIEGIFEEDEVKLKVFETRDEHGEKLMRIILPDDNLKFPEESEIYPYTMQYEGPYCIGKLN